jgi:hypothetical protein
MIKDSEMLGVRIPTADKTLLKEFAESNLLTMSDLARIMLKDCLLHFNERNFLRPGA